MARARMKKVKKSQANYRKNPESAAKKAAYDKKYNSSPERKKYRRELAAERRKRGIMGKGGKDVSHTTKGTTLESASKNRARHKKKK